MINLTDLLQEKTYKTTLSTSSNWVVYHMDNSLKIKPIKVVKSEEEALKWKKKYQQHDKLGAYGAVPVKHWNKYVNAKKLKEGKLTEGYSMSKSIAKTIVDQLGGRRFQMFVGAKKFLIDGKALFFKIGRNSKSINGIKIYYNSKDLYDIEFLRVSKKGTKVYKKVKDIYNDQLQNVFSQYTGMATRF